MVEDREGFKYPQIDKNICVACGCCNGVCSSLHHGNRRQPRAVFAAMANDMTVRGASSSGGVFSLLAMDVLRDGGVVYGAGWDKKDWRVIHKRIERADGLEELRGSKYVQSEVLPALMSAKFDVDKGRRVLFSGTPCQVAALNAICGRGRTNLLTVEVICHAVPSPLAWQKYLQKRLSEAYKQDGSEGKIRQISFRYKNCGWKQYALFVCFANHKTYLSEVGKDLFMSGFLSNLYNRPACSHCTVKELRSGADVTIGDYWGVSSRFPDMDDDMGTSLVLVNTEVGLDAWRRIVCGLKVKESDFAHACNSNHAIYEQPSRHFLRDYFFRHVRSRDFDALVYNIVFPSLPRRCWRFVVRMVGKALKRI